MIGKFWTFLFFLFIAPLEVILTFAKVSAYLSGETIALNRL